MPRYVILHHTTPPGYRQGTHYDLMLEEDGKLLTWALAELPRVGLQIQAVRLPDHRLGYLEYEGPISGDGGEVRRVDAGEYLSLHSDDSQATFDLHSASGGFLRVQLHHEAEERWTAQCSAVT